MVQHLFEAEVSAGLAEIANKELQQKMALSDIRIGTDNIQFTATLQTIPTDIWTVNSIYLLLRYKIPRPKALLGHQNFSRLIDALKTIIAFNEKHAFSTFYISAAGSESSVMKRIRNAISKQIDLAEGDVNGDLLIRIRRNKKYGWDVLLRITPRPHATRFWRTCNYEGAINGPTAHAMIYLSDNLNPDDIIVNLACGSGTLMIERMMHSNTGSVIGFDHDQTALDCAHRNLASANFTSKASLIQADIRYLPLSNNFASHLYADLPFGQRIGSHEQNVEQYPEILSEAARICKVGGIFTLITHEIRLIEHALQNSEDWSQQNMVKTTQRGYHPRIYVLRKR